MLGEQTYWTLRYLRLLQVLILIQFFSVLGVPIVPVLGHAFSEGSLFQIAGEVAFYSWLSIIHLLSAYGLIRLVTMSQFKTSSSIVFSIIAIFPCIQIFALLSVISPVEDSLERQGVPFLLNGPDWQALREMAARQSTGEMPVPPGNPS